MAKSSVRVAILGASGYAGAELVRLLAHHPHAEIAAVTGERRAGKPLGEVFPHLAALNLPDLVAVEQLDWDELDVDVVFSALPHGTSQKLAQQLLTPGTTKAARFIDLAADFRLADPAVYRQWYGHDHHAVDLQPQAVYGLTEFARDAVRTAYLVACPGCYPTSALLPLVPLLEDGAIVPSEIIIDAKSGVSGAGRAEKEANLFCEVSEAIHPYGIASHRHAPEIEQSLTRAANEVVTVTFTPHLVPMNRGILSTIYVRLTDGISAADARQALVDRFNDEPFVTVLDGKQVPSTRMVRGTNRCAINVFADRVPGRAIVVSAIDNLVKGAAGQGVQNMNVAFGFAEADGLDLEPLFPVTAHGGIILPYRGTLPRIAADVFIAANAAVIGDVEIGAGSSVWFAATVRGDVNYVRIGARTNVQDGTTVHVTTGGNPTLIGDDVTIGHNAIVHACTIGDLSLIGMGAVVMDGVVVEREAMIAAGALVTPGKRVPSRQLWGGSPARFMRELRPREIAELTESAHHYAELAAEYRAA